MPGFDVDLESLVDDTQRLCDMAKSVMLPTYLSEITRYLSLDQARNKSTLRLGTIMQEVIAL